MPADGPEQRPDTCRGDLRSELRDADWDDIYPRLLLATKGLLKGRVGLGSPHDFVHDAIMKTLDGEIRRWDPSQTTLFRHLYGVIHSDISHPSKGYGGAIEQPVEDAVIIQFEDHRPNAEDKQIEESHNQHFFEFVDKHDTKAGTMSRLILKDGLKESKEFSEAMDMPVSRIDRLKKKLRKISVSYMSKTSSRTEQIQSAGVVRKADRRSDNDV